MELQAREINKEKGSVLISLSGDIDSTTAAQLKSHLQSHVEQQRYWLILDFANVHYVNSAGMGVIAGVIKTAQEHGGGVRFLHVSGALEELFHIVRFDRLVTYFENEQDAIASLT